MKGLGFFDKIILTINTLVAFLLLISYLLPYVPPKTFPLLAVLSLGVPFLILINGVFLIFWLLRLKKQFFLSLIILGLGWNYINAFYKIELSKHVPEENDFTVMSYNVRLFNKYKWISNKSVKADIQELINIRQPDILCLQEYRQGDPLELKGYYDFNATYSGNFKGGQVIYSKFPILNSNSLEFPNTHNNAIFVDVIKDKDTLRIYNVHFQSSKIDTNVDALKKVSSESLFKRIGTTFKTQQEQVELLKTHQNQSSYKTIITGDFNNTAYSYVYNELRKGFLDTFEEAGSSFGKTFNFKFFPLRIDFILVDDKAFEVKNHETLDIELSDHYPILTTLELHE